MFKKEIGLTNNSRKSSGIQKMQPIFLFARNKTKNITCMVNANKETFIYALSLFINYYNIVLNITFIFLTKAHYSGIFTLLTSIEYIIGTVTSVPSQDSYLQSGGSKIGQK